MGSSLITILLAVVLAVGSVGATSYVAQDTAPETPVDGEVTTPVRQQLWLCQALAETIETRYGQAEQVDDPLVDALQTRLRAMNLVCNGDDVEKLPLLFRYAKDGLANGNLYQHGTGLHLQIGSHQYSIGGPQGVQNGGNDNAGPSDSAGGNGGDGGNGGGNGNGH